jgi:hypothetical protein
MTESDKRFEWQGASEPVLRNPFSTNPAFLETNMERAIRAVLGMIVGGAVGALGSAVIGATVGLLMWGSGLVFVYDWRDMPIAGAIFGMVVGSIGGTITGATLGAAREWTGRRRMPALAVAAILFGSVPGILIGFFLFFNWKGLAEALLFGMLGGLGGAIGGVIAKWIWS